MLYPNPNPSRILNIDLNRMRNSQSTLTLNLILTLSLTLTRTNTQVEVARYRPNILVGGAGVEPFAEDAWQEVQLGSHRLLVDGAQSRVSMRARFRVTATLRVRVWVYKDGHVCR